MLFGWLYIGMHAGMGKGSGGAPSRGVPTGVFQLHPPIAFQTQRERSYLLNVSGCSLTMLPSGRYLSRLKV